MQVDLEIWGEIADDEYVGNDPEEYSDAFPVSGHWQWRWYNNEQLDGTSLLDPDGNTYDLSYNGQEANTLDPNDETIFFSPDGGESYEYVQTETRGTWIFAGGVAEEYDWLPPLVEIRRPTDVIYNLLSEELNVPEKHFITHDKPDPDSPITQPFDKRHVSYLFGGQNFEEARQHHDNWFLDFSVHQAIPAKRLLAEVAQNSKSIPHLTLNKFKFINIKDEWEWDDLNHFIYKKDILSYNFSLTPVSEVICQSTIQYAYDYGLENYKKETNPYVADTFIDSYNTNYDSGFYNLPKYDTINQVNYPDSSESFTSKYIQDEQTAIQLAKHRVQFFCNRRLRCELDLPFKYLYLGVGDIVTFMNWNKMGQTTHINADGDTSGVSVYSDPLIDTQNIYNTPSSDDDTTPSYAVRSRYRNWDYIMNTGTKDNRVSNLENDVWEDKPFGIDINGEVTNADLGYKVTPYNGQDLTPFYIVVSKVIDVESAQISLTLEQLRNF